MATMTSPVTAASTPIPRRPDPTSLGGRIALEWSRLRLRPTVLADAGRWGILEAPIRDLDEVLTAVGYETGRDPAADERLRRLVLIAADDELAARVVVQRIVPGLLAVVRRRRRQGVGPEALEELLGAAWIAIRTFNPHRRPTCLAAALISDADYRAFRSTRRRRSAGERPTDLSADADQLGTTSAPNPGIELAELFALAAESGVPDADLELMRQLLAAPTVNELARELDITPRTVRNRRDRIALRLREVALAA